MNPQTAMAPAAAPAELPTLRAITQNDLAQVNRVIMEQARNDIALIEQVASHIIAAGGKRLRPCLTITAARLCGYEGDRHIKLAACVEFLHTATLLHDDVVDESTLRRGTATANAVWGNQSSVLVGDFLLSRAFQLMVTDGEIEVLKILSDAAAVISAGEVQQLMLSRDLSITQEQHEAIISAKTAALFAAACEIGAAVGNKPAWREPLRAYGEALGMAFQLVDDALDYAASEQELGKTIGDDLREGKVTLPVLHAYAHGTTEERAFWEQALSDPQEITPALLTQAKRLLMKYDAFGYSIKRAEHFAQLAIRALEAFPESQPKQALREAAEFTVSRSY